MSYKLLSPKRELTFMLLKSIHISLAQSAKTGLQPAFKIAFVDAIKVFDGTIISLPEIFIEHANLSERVIFVGQGRKFQMWNPENFDEFKRDSKIKALEHRNLIGPSHIDNFNKEALD